MADLIYHFMLFVFCPLALVLFTIKFSCLVKELFCPLKRVKDRRFSARDLEVASRLAEHSTYTL